MSQPYGGAQYPQSPYAAPVYNQAAPIYNQIPPMYNQSAPMYNQAVPAYGYAQPGEVHLWTPCMLQSLTLAVKDLLFCRIHNTNVLTLSKNHVKLCAHSIMACLNQTCIVFTSSSLC